MLSRLVLLVPWTTPVQSSIFPQLSNPVARELHCWIAVQSMQRHQLYLRVPFRLLSSNIFRLWRDPHLKDFPQSCSVFYLDGNYSIPNPGEWESWSPCSVSCGPQEGVQFRNRPCAKNPSLFNITDGFESRACNVDAVPCAKGDWKLMAILNKLNAQIM